MPRLLFPVVLVLALLSTSVGAAQQLPVSVDGAKQTIAVGKHRITAKTTLAALVDALGSATRVVQVGGKDRHYIYEDLSLSFDLGKEGLVEAVMVTYHSDGDKKAAKAPFGKSLTVNAKPVDGATGPEAIKAIVGVSHLKCVPTLCLTDPRQGGMVFMIGYNDDKQITQITFGFNPGS